MTAPSLDGRTRARDKHYRAETNLRTRLLRCQICDVRPGQGEDGINAHFGFVLPLDHLEYQAVCWACFHTLRRADRSYQA